ncbi:adenylosuccinate synthase [Candidatus Actinomarina sp.]|jgi:adenylosuccinate synthase|nr:adenylosuccinate synthase [Acidimicrobiia bacterium]MDA7572198.1 adenylosuccinate synthase [bacterium]MDB2368061.1 adenylosuccinate synthase [Candidatus Actinomarina sp.]MDA7594964.1 adenylosuccinate synthase [Acidimicrobiia bacterium]MDA8923171.1 adenylosuccinate synthase [Acidimicrobiia bacterium]|tara:strand:+ start:804 stop:2084 length:1281 start_codon:yes stop_codon:yes gene_type:complete
MTATVVLGAQWGDEGKGKVTDFFASSADYVVRFQGGNNAGHTIVVGNEKLALSLTPSGVLYPDCVPVIGSGCVVDLGFLKQELAMLNSKNVSTQKLAISPNAHLIMPYHKLLDELIEESLGENKIGTTKKGIGPCYADKIQRNGIRVQDLLNDEIFAQKVKINVKEKNQILTKIYNKDPLDPEEIINEFKIYKDIVNNHVKDTSLMISDAIKANKNILFEGAQGTLLDIDHGTYPFVTSSNTSSGNAATGSGIGPLNLDKIVGVTKAYISRVGSGPFITEQKNEIGEYLIEKGAEFGVVTGRRRRCGWLDLISLKYSVRVNSLSELFITKLDVLSGLEELKLGIGYKNGDEIINDYPYEQNMLYDAQPIYDTFEGWSEDITSVKKFNDLPENAKKYINAIEEYIQIPITFISVGPERNQNIVITDD